MQQERRLPLFLILFRNTDPRPAHSWERESRWEQRILCTTYLSVPLTVHDWSISKLATPSSLESRPPNGPNTSDKEVSRNIAPDRNRMGKRRPHTTTYILVDPKLIPYGQIGLFAATLGWWTLQGTFCIERDGEPTLASSFSLFVWTFLNI